MQTPKQTLKEIQTLKEMFKDRTEQFPWLMQQLDEEERYFKNELEDFDDRNVQEIDLKDKDHSKWKMLKDNGDSKWKMLK